MACDRMKTETVTVNFKGWFLFCPVYFEDIKSEGLCPIPRKGFWWLFEPALMAQQFLNWFLSFVNPDACGFMAYAKPMKPKTITFETE